MVCGGKSVKEGSRLSKFLSRADLERIAGTVVYRYYPQCGTLPVPIDPSEVASLVMGLNISYYPLSEDGTILGMACFQNTEIGVRDSFGTHIIKLTGRDIVIDSSLRKDQSGRRNFTIAHELAHHVLVRLYPDDYQELLDCRKHVLYRGSRDPSDWDEWQADVMAAAILMPPETVLYCMYLFGLNERMDTENAVCKAKMYGRLCDMAAYLDVSRKALAIRMRQMELPDGKADGILSPDKMRKDSGGDACRNSRPE